MMNEYEPDLNYKQLTEKEGNEEEIEPIEEDDMLGFRIPIINNLVKEKSLNFLKKYKS